VGDGAPAGAPVLPLYWEFVNGFAIAELTSSIPAPAVIRSAMMRAATVFLMSASIRTQFYGFKKRSCQGF